VPALPQRDTIEWIVLCVGRVAMIERMRLVITAVRSEQLLPEGQLA
jgi:hypothetical protein